MLYILQAIFIFLRLLKIIIIIHIIFSWLQLAGLHIRIKFIEDIINPIYREVKKIIPTTIGPIDFAPIIVFIIIDILQAALIKLFI